LFHSASDETAGSYIHHPINAFHLMQRASTFWDRFYKTPFRPKDFRINFHPQIFDKFPALRFFVDSRHVG
jgi:hypothetical protein